MVFNFQVVAVFFVSAFLLSIILNKIFLRFTTNLGTRSSGEVRFASTSKPSVGGFTFYISFLLCFISIVLIFPEYLLENNREAAGLFAACSLGFILGFADDAYNTNPVLKFSGQIACGIILVFSDLYIPLIDLSYSGAFAINTAFTVIWVIGIMNSINMLDNMDAITTSVSICVLGCILYMLGVENYKDVFTTLIVVCAMATLIGFLVFNWHPARMYMGDTGSQFLGVLLAALSIKLLWQFRDVGASRLQVQQFLLPLMAFIMPIIDTTTVFIRRIARGQSPFKGGTDHTTHHLAYLGISVRMVAMVFIILSLVSIWIIHLIASQPSWNYLYSYAIIGYFIILFLGFQFLYDIGAKRKPE